jgi:hypothetical protein
MSHQLLVFVLGMGMMPLCAVGTESTCDTCTLGKLSADVLAAVETCDSRAGRNLVAAFNQGCFTHYDDDKHAAVSAKVNQCTEAVSIENIYTVSQCLTHVGPKGTIIALTTLLTYISILPIAISLRPSLAVKCD